MIPDDVVERALSQAAHSKNKGCSARDWMRAALQVGVEWEMENFRRCSPEAVKAIIDALKMSQQDRQYLDEWLPAAYEAGIAAASRASSNHSATE